jgi:predicted RNase H-like nuclease (RuvC/YqgF family)
MSASELQGWVTLAITIVLLVRTFVGDGRKGIETAKAELKSEINANKAETANLRANLSDFQLKVAQEYIRNEQLGPRLERIENMLAEVLTGRRHER